MMCNVRVICMALSRIVAGSASDAIHALITPGKVRRAASYDARTYSPGRVSNGNILQAGIKVTNMKLFRVSVTFTSLYGEQQ